MKNKVVPCFKIEEFLSVFKEKSTKLENMNNTSLDPRQYA